MRKAFIILCLTAIVIGIACKTTRRKDEVSKLGKFYHNTTAKYNGFFNANVLIEESLEQLSNSFDDNYNQLLPIYKWHGAPNVESQFSSLDTAIKKVSVVASIHEPSVWTDDCYLLAGKAQYIKQDYEEAQKTFEYLLNEFDPSNPSSRFWEYRQDEIRKRQRKLKKAERERREEMREEREEDRKRSRRQEIRERRRQKRNNSKSRKKKAKEETQKASEQESNELESNPLYEPSFNEDDYTKGGHEPAFKEGQLWLAKTYIERDRFSNSLNLLRKLSNDASLDRKLKEKVNATMGKLFIAEREYRRANTYLEKALNIGKDRQQNARYAYIIAQLYQLEGNASQASKFYAEASRLSNDYVMEFSARMQEIKNKFISGEASKEKTFTKLENELEDSKNTEYIDQIYYAMAQVARESGDKELSQQYLTQALKNSQGNNTIALEAYYSLGDFYFERDEFRKAKLYYDSVMQVIPKTDPRYLQSKRRQTNLTRLDEQLAILEENDSALIIAEMTPEERQKLAQKILIKQREEQEARQEQKEEEKQQAYASLSQESDFFAYDARKVRDGKATFDLKWGNRPLIDDWRRKTKLRIETGGTHPDTINETVLEDIPSAKEREQVLGRFPQTESEIAATKQQIVKALYEMGVIYRERFDRPDLAVDVLTELIDRFPRSTKDVEALYLQVLSYRDLGNQQKEEKYTKILLDRYPNSKYARIIKNPEYVEDLQKAAERVEMRYQEAYTEFQRGNFARSVQISEQAQKTFSSEESYMPKFKLLEAMAKGKVSGRESYINELRELISTYERSPEAVRAREIIRFLNGNENAFAQKEGQIGDFVTDDDKLHYVIAVLYNSDEIDMTSAKISVSDFNKEYFKLKGLVPSTIYLDLNKGIPLIIVRNFDNKKDAMRYYQTAKQYADEFLPKRARYDLFAVTQRNYRVILKQKTIESYRPFFEQYYLRSDDSN